MKLHCIKLNYYIPVDVVADPEQVRGINEDWLTLAPLLFYYRELALDPNTVSALIRSEYFPNNVTIGRNTLPDLADLYGDRLFYHGDRKSILSHFTNTQKNKQPTYLYHFSFHSNNSIVRLTPVTETLGKLRNSSPSLSAQLSKQFLIDDMPTFLQV